jgi:hypothetical protein
MKKRLANRFSVRALGDLAEDGVTLQRNRTTLYCCTAQWQDRHAAGKVSNWLDMQARLGFRHGASARSCAAVSSTD